MASWPTNTQHLSEALVVLLGQPLRSLVQHLESNCIYGCCYMDAFDISAENAGVWVKTVDAEQRHLCLGQLKEVLVAVRATTLPVYVEKLGDVLKREEAVTFFERIEGALLATLGEKNA